MRLVLTEQPCKVREINNDIVIKVCERLGLNISNKWKILAEKNKRKVRSAIAKIINESKISELKNNSNNYGVEVIELNDDESVKDCEIDVRLVEKVHFCFFNLFLILH